ncbi:unnamed protein product [Candida verbasci]|uniref:Uncharacterized protein n=1 Tax=Candida verbasci TaxID=1227364 RepID=A0A9W4TWZ6_9ASCO|nr:unnamed protein product [Candida verbasci]
MDDSQGSIKISSNEDDDEYYYARQNELKRLDNLEGDKRKAKLREIKKSNSRRFQNEWKSILDKYSKIDDSKQSDEINILTGEVITNNGHLEELSDDEEGGLWNIVDSDQSENETPISDSLYDSQGDTAKFVDSNREEDESRRIIKALNKGNRYKKDHYTNIDKDDSFSLGSDDDTMLYDDYVVKHSLSCIFRNCKFTTHDPKMYKKHLMTGHRPKPRETNVTKSRDTNEIKSRDTNETFDEDDDSRINDSFIIDDESK